MKQDPALFCCVLKKMLLTNIQSPGWFFRSVFLILFLSRLAVNAGIIDDSNPLAIPAVGSHGLRVIHPKLLELSLITTKLADPAPVSEWNFIQDSGAASLPAVSEFQVLVDGLPVSVQSVGFKRRIIYAPLGPRDVRIGNHLYLQLASPVETGARVEVQNLSRTLWGVEKEFTAAADLMRWSPVIHLNQEGYLPTLQKRAFVGFYAGSLGEATLPIGDEFEVMRVEDGTVVRRGRLSPRKDVGFDVRKYSPLPYQKVLQADFSSVVEPGKYQLLIRGLGVSFPFLIDEGMGANFARTYALGLFHQRCGAGKEFPFARHTHGACHLAPAEVPTVDFAQVNSLLRQLTEEGNNQRQTAPRLTDVNASLYPFVNKGKIDVSGGHHDAGDYSKYTINVAQLIHSLVFSADVFPGVGDLDNLGLPESGDGRSDILQMAKWEADFLAKLQDADGGFYFMVYPRDRRYEDTVLPDKGDPQVVFPKNTAATAAAVAALAQISSSPLFKTQFPESSAIYLEKALKGWAFLQRAFQEHGRDGSYQRMTHYGDEFLHDDELAWAAAELFLATGDATYQTELISHYEPSNIKTFRWDWWRLFEGYGCAARSYGFAARTGRRGLTELKPAYLAKCQEQIRLGAADHVRFINETAYETSFPTPSKQQRTAGWYFSAQQSFDIAVGAALDGRDDYLNPIMANMNYEAGANPLNISFLTGIGAQRQREIVSQYAHNDHRILPPSGIPLGAIWEGFHRMGNFGWELVKLNYPKDDSTAGPYAFYDRWGDTFDTTAEFVVPQAAQALGAMAFVMARTSLKDQPWRSEAATIVDLPEKSPVLRPVTARLSAPGVDLSNARIVWEATDQQPKADSRWTFSPKNIGRQWIEAEALLPDGRRVVAKSSFMATSNPDLPPNSFQSAPLSVTPDVLALYHGDSLLDSTGENGPLTLGGNAALDTANLGWMASPSGQAIRFTDLGDKARVTFPNPFALSGESDKISVESMVYITGYRAFLRGNPILLNLSRNDWNARIQLMENMYQGPSLRGGSSWEISGPTISRAIPTNEWFHFSLTLDKERYAARVNGVEIASKATSEFSNWGTSGNFTLEFGDFEGWMDEICVRGTRIKATPASAPPSMMPDAGIYTNGVYVSMGAANEEASVRFTLDGTDPTTNSPLYSRPLTLIDSALIKARAFNPGSTESPVTSKNYIVIHPSEHQANDAAVFLGVDSGTRGDWKNIYGTEGFKVIGGDTQLPPYLTLNASGKNDYIWTDTTSEPRAPFKSISSVARVLSSWYSPDSFSVNLAFNDGQSHRLALYVLDWTSTDRVQTIEVINNATGQIVDERTVSAFSGGQYLIWKIKGNITFRFTRLTGANAVLQGIFLDRDQEVLIKTLVPKVSNGQLNLQLSGEIGQTFIIQTSSNLVDWAPLATHTLTTGNGTELFRDPGTIDGQLRFYRALIVE